jgi:hypothetical protein
MPLRCSVCTKDGGRRDKTTTAPPCGRCARRGTCHDGRAGPPGPCAVRRCPGRSHDELRAALIVAGKHIRKLSFGRKVDPVLQVLRRVLRDARAVGKGARRRDYAFRCRALERVRAHPGPRLPERGLQAAAGWNAGGVRLPRSQAPPVEKHPGGGECRGRGAYRCTPATCTPATLTP